MLRMIGWCLSLLVFCGGCAATAPPSPVFQLPQAMAPAPAPGPAPEQVAAAPNGGPRVVDTACSYFYFLLGKNGEGNGRYPEALEFYQKALACDPQADSVIRALALYYTRMGRREEAVQLLDRLLVTQPNDLDILTLKGNLHAAMGQAEEAAAVYNAILAINPKHGNTLLLLGSLYARSGQHDKAQEVLERLVRMDDRSFAGFQYLAKLYREVGDLDKSAAAYDKALALHWLPELALEAAELYEHGKKYDRAMDLCRRILEDEPEHDRARQRMVGLLLRKGRVDEALDQLWEWRQFVTDSREIDYTIGRILLEQERFDQAIDHFADMLKAEPGSDNVRYLLALAYAAKGDREDALGLLRSITPAAELFEDAVMLQVELLLKGNSVAEAETLLVKAISDPVSRRPRFYAGLGGIYRRLSRIEEGRQVFKQGLALYAKDVPLHYDYGLFLDRIGANDEAIAAMEQVLALEPQNPHALNYIGYSWADSGRNLQEALQYIEQAVALRPEDGFIRDSLGWVYFKLGDHKRAQAELEKALELAEDPVILEHMGDVLRAMGKAKEAVAAYERGAALIEKDSEKKEERQRLLGKIKALRRSPR